MHLEISGAKAGTAAGDSKLSPGKQSLATAPLTTHFSVAGTEECLPACRSGSPGAWCLQHLRVLFMSCIYGQYIDRKISCMGFT